MDPLMHSLFGAALGETSLSRRTPLARATLIIAANLPDIDAACVVLGRDAALDLRRGHTHGVLAVFLLPVVLTAVIVLYDRSVRDPYNKPPVDWRWILGLAFLGVLSHPALDWLNTYGVRLLMPFERDWFYGDSIYIIDPWLWLLAAAAVFPRHSDSRRSRINWGILGGLITLAVLLVGRVPIWAKVVWPVALLVLVALRSKLRNSRLPVAAAMLALMGLYVGGMILGTGKARAQAEAWYASQGIVTEQVFAGPVLMEPWKRRIVARSGLQYYVAELSWLSTPRLHEAEPPVPIGNGPIATKALFRRRGLRRWIRFPAFEVEDLGGHDYRVRIRDVRYPAGRGSPGQAVVEVPHEP